MGKWKKSFRKIPPKTKVEIDRIATSEIKVVAGKRIALEDIDAGLYEHLGLEGERLEVGAKWEAMPPARMGTRSKRNTEGWEHVRRDLPKYKKYFYHDIQNFGDASTYGWSTVAIPREVYERDSYPPYLFHIEIEVRERFSDGSLGVVFAIDEAFDRSAGDFEQDLLFAINLLQENTGVHGVSGEENPNIVFTGALSWELFPPGDVDDLVSRICANAVNQNTPNEEDVRERLKLFEQFEPIQYLKGLGGSDHYIGAKYSDDLVVFENFKHGNALYALYENWEQISRLPRSEILRLSTSKFDRIIHTEGWQNRFALLMQTELRARGIRVRIGRNIRKNR